MKKSFTIFVFTLFTLALSAQVSKTIEVTIPGNLSTLLTEDEKSTVTNLTVTGTIDARDIKCMRDQMSVLSDIDLSESSIVAYDGGVATYPYSTSYPANEVPAYSFRNYYLSLAKASLNSIILPKTLISIAKSAFSTCPNLKSINIGNSITTIGDDAFIGCYGLTTVKMGNSVTTIGKTAFQYCYALNDLTIGDNVVSIGEAAFDDCTSLTNLVIPNTMTTINPAFSRLGITELRIPASVSKIEGGAFYGCSKIKTIYSLNPTPPVCDNPFILVTNVTDVYVPASAVSTYKSAPVWGDCFYSQIKAIPFSGTNAPLSNKEKVYSSRTEIIIDGTDKGEIVNIFSLDGKSLKKIESLGEQIVMPVQNNNVYLVKTGTKTFKVVL